MKIELYVPTITPKIKTIINSLKVDPPRINIENNTNKVVILVPNDLIIDSLIEIFILDEYLLSGNLI